MANEYIARRGEGKSANDRPRDFDTHDETKASIRSTVGSVRGNDGKRYNVIVERPNVEEGYSGPYGLEIRDAKEPTKTVYEGIAKGHTGAPNMTPEMQKALDQALSKDSDGGTALTYKEAAQLVNLALPKKETTRER